MVKWIRSYLGYVVRYRDTQRSTRAGRHYSMLSSNDVGEIKRILKINRIAIGLPLKAERICSETAYEPVCPRSLRP